MNKKQLIELYYKLDMVLFDNVMMFVSEEDTECMIDDQKRSIEESMSIVKGEIERRFGLQGKGYEYEEWFDGLFTGRLDTDEIKQKLSEVGNKKNRVDYMHVIE